MHIISRHFHLWLPLLLACLCTHCGDTHDRSHAPPDPPEDANVSTQVLPSNETPSVSAPSTTEPKKASPPQRPAYMDHPLYSQLQDVHARLGQPIIPPYHHATLDRAPHTRSISPTPSPSTPPKPPTPKPLQVQNCITGDKPTPAMIFEEDLHHSPQDLFLPNGQSGVLHVKYIRNKAELKKFFNLDVRGKSSLFNVYNAQAQSTYFNNALFTQDNIYHSFNLEIENPAITMKNIRLTQDAYDLLTQKGLSAFYKRCGQEAIIGYITGGYIKIIMKISRESKQHDTSLKAALNVDGMALDIDSMISLGKTSNTQKYTVDLFTQFAGGVGSTMYTELADIKKMSQQWPQTVAKNAVVTRVIRKPYTELISHVVDKNFERRLRILESLDDELTRLLNIRDVLIKKAYYQNVSAKKIKTYNEKHLENTIRDLYQALDQCSRALRPQDCHYTTTLNNAVNFKPFIRLAHKSCGPVLRQVKGPHSSCGQKAQAPTRRRHASCGKIFSKKVFASATYHDQTSAVASTAQQLHEILDRDFKADKARLRENVKNNSHHHPHQCQTYGFPVKVEITNTKKEWSHSPCLTSTLLPYIRASTSPPLDLHLPRVERTWGRCMRQQAQGTLSWAYRYSCHGTHKDFGWKYARCMVPATGPVRYKSCTVTVKTDRYKTCAVAIEHL